MGIYFSGGNWLTFLPQFFLGFSGMPTVGFFITLIGLSFFFLMILDSHIERKLATPITLGIPRWHKRVTYYLFKIRYIQLHNKKFKNLPNYKIQKALQRKYFNEYEVINS